jgi:GntR family transcriptional regulator / MocR family aminotransferase
MRRLKGALLPPVRAERLRRGDVYGSLRSAMLDGALAPGERLPSTRLAAADYGVSRGMLEEVYAQLTEEGFLHRAVGQGTFVAWRMSRLSAPAHGQKRIQRLPAPSRRGNSVAAMAACREPAIPRPFNAGIADTSEFPWNIWQRLQARAVREVGRSGLNFADPRGLPNLRRAIAHYLAQFRGIRCDPQQVIIFNSAQQALHNLALLLLNPSDSVWIEDPCYLGARAAFRLAGATLIPVPVDKEGIRVEVGLGRAPHARLAYVTPSHQYPTGVALSLDRRIELIKWAARKNAWIVEDDYDGEFRYEGQPLTALYSLDPHGRVLYIGTMNKAMFVSLRIAYAVVPGQIVEPLANIRTQLDGFTPAMRQMALSLFMHEGHFSSHLRRMRALYGAKRAMLSEGLAPLAACGWTWSSNPAGMHLLAAHERGAYVRAVAESSSLDLALLSSYRTARGRDDGLFLRFGALEPASLRSATAQLVEVAQTINRA